MRIQRLLVTRSTSVLAAFLALGAPLAAQAAGPGGLLEDVESLIAKQLEQSCNDRYAGIISVDEYEGLRNREVPPALNALQGNVRRVGFNGATFDDTLARRIGHDEHYSHVIPHTKIPDQQKSGRCWIFAKCSSLMNEAFNAGKVAHGDQASQSYLHWFNQLEKTNKFLNDRIADLNTPAMRNPALRAKFNVAGSVDDGGYHEFVEFLIAKYGMVPRSVFGESFNSLKTAELLDQLHQLAGRASGKLLDTFETFHLKPGQRMSEEQFAQLHAIRVQANRETAELLRAAMGTPPSLTDKFAVHLPDGTVQWHTPHSYAAFLGFKQGDLVTVGASPFSQHKVNQVLTLPGSSIGVKKPEEPGDIYVLNTTPERIKELVRDSILAKKPVWFAADVSHNIDPEVTGIMHPDLYNPTLALNQTDAERLPANNRGSGTFLGTRGADHAMVFTGVDLKDPQDPKSDVRKFLVENSWNKLTPPNALDKHDKGMNGMMHMYPEFFDGYVYEVVVPRSLLNDSERAALAGPATPVSELEFPF